MNNLLKLRHTWSDDCVEYKEEKFGATWAIKPIDKSSLMLECVVQPLTTIKVKMDSHLEYLHGRSVFKFSKIQQTPEWCLPVKLLENLSSKSFTNEDDELSDVVFKVQEIDFHVHKQFLSVLSPVFKSMLYGRFEEASKKVIELPEKNATLFGDFLTVLYNIHPLGNSYQRAYSLYPLFAEYQVKCYMNHCLLLFCSFLQKAEERVDEMNLYNADMYRIAEVAELYDLKDIYDRAVAIISRTATSQLIKCERFLSLSYKTQANVYLKRLMAKGD